MSRITAKGQPAKPSREVRPGDMLQIRNEAGSFEVEVLGVSAQRTAAAIAQALYRETKASKELREKAAEERKLLGPLADTYSSRPSKRDRRLIHSFNGRG